MGAEAPAAHSDAVLVAEDGGDQPVVDPGDRERDDADLVGRPVGVGRTVDREPGHAGQALDRVPGELALVGGDAVEPDRR